MRTETLSYPCLQFSLPPQWLSLNCKVNSILKKLHIKSNWSWIKFNLIFKLEGSKRKTGEGCLWGLPGLFLHPPLPLACEGQALDVRMSSECSTSSAYNVGQVFIDSSNVYSPVSFEDCPYEKEFIWKAQKDTAEVHNVVLNVHIEVLNGKYNRQQYSFILVRTQAHHSASLSWLKLQIHFHRLWLKWVKLGHFYYSC